MFPFVLTSFEIMHTSQFPNFHKINTHPQHPLDHVPGTGLIERIQRCMEELLSSVSSERKRRENPVHRLVTMPCGEQSQARCRGSREEEIIPCLGGSGKPP